MATSGSITLPLGSDLPDFWLPDTDGAIVPRDHLLDSSAILVIFMCNHSPFVKHVREVMLKIIWEYRQRGVQTVAINANDINSHPEDRPDQMKVIAQTFGYSFPYLFDGTQETARMFKAVFHPDFFLFDKKGKLVYHGQMDDSRPGNGKPVTGNDLRSAINSILLGEKMPIRQKRGEGCNILWKDGLAPAYAVTRSPRSSATILRPGKPCICYSRIRQEQAIEE